MSYSKKVANNTFVQTLGRVVSTTISFFLVAYLARTLGVSGFGEYSIVFAYLGLFAVLSDFGLFYLLVKKLSAEEDDQVKVSSDLISLRTILALVIYSVAVLAIYLSPYSDSVKLSVTVVSISFLFTSVQNTVFAIFQAKYKMHWPVISDIISRLVILGVVLVLAENNFSLPVIMSGYSIGALVGTIFIVYKARQIIPFGFSFDRTAWVKILKEGFAFGVAIIFSYLYFKVDTLMLSVMKSLEDVGIYAPAVKVLEVILIFPMMFIGTILPIYSRYIAQGDTRISLTIQKAFDVLSIVMAILIGGIFAIAPAIIEIVAGKEFLSSSTIELFNAPATAVTVLSVLIVAGAFSFLVPVFSYVLIAAGKQNKLIVPNIIFLLLNVALNIFLIPRYSYVGAAVATIITELLVLGTNFYLAKKEIDFSLSYKVLIKSLTISFVMIIVIKFLGLYWVFSIILGAAVFSGLAIIFKAVPRDVILLLKNYAKKT